MLTGSGAVLIMIKPDQSDARAQLRRSGQHIHLSRSDCVLSAAARQSRLQFHSTLETSFGSVPLFPQLTGRSMPVCKMFGGSYLGTSVLQVALIVVMAQIGSFVPASFVSMHVVDKLFTRIGTSDSIETNSSSFMVEMQETAHIVNHATNR